MKRINRLCIGVFLAAVLILSSCSKNDQEEKQSRVEQLPYYNSAEFTPRWLEQGDATLTDFHQIPEFQLQNQFGRPVSEKSVTGKIFVADFFFATCPGICPKMAGNMLIVQEAFKHDDQILLLSHSVTPEQDSVAALKAYGDRNNCLPGKWHLLTGDREQIYSLGRKAYFVEEDMGLKKSEDDFLHSENFLLVDQNRRLRGIYNGLNKTDIQQLIADIHTLKKESLN
ncbi:MAG: SCO family protein [Calditrichia bacterium]